MTKLIEKWEEVIQLPGTAAPAVEEGYELVGVRLDLSGRAIHFYRRLTAVAIDSDSGFPVGVWSAPAC